MPHHPTRRDMLWAASALAATAAVATGKPATARPQPENRPTENPLPPELVPGMALGPCRLARLLPVERGALPFELSDTLGHVFVVEVHRHDPQAPGIARAGSCDVFLVNGGTGATATDETRGLGAMALASVLARREAAGRPLAELPQLVSIRQRWTHDPPPAPGHAQ